MGRVVADNGSENLRLGTNEDEGWSFKSCLRIESSEFVEECLGKEGFAGLEGSLAG